MFSSHRIRIIPGFTLIEVLVVMAILAVLISIGFVVGSEFKTNAQRLYTKMELKNLVAVLTEVREKTGKTPLDMTELLTTYQELHAYKDADGKWRIGSNYLTTLPYDMVQTGIITAPDGTNMTGITEVYDAFGTQSPIQYISSQLMNRHAPCFFSYGPEPAGEIAMGPLNIHSYDP